MTETLCTAKYGFYVMKPVTSKANITENCRRKKKVIVISSDVSAIVHSVAIATFVYLYTHQ